MELLSGLQKEEKRHASSQRYPVRCKDASTAVLSTSMQQSATAGNDDDITLRDVIIHIGHMRVSMEQRFDGVEKRMDGMEERMKRMDDRFDMIDVRFDMIDKRFDAVDEDIRALGMDIIAIKLHVGMPVVIE